MNLKKLILNNSGIKIFSVILAISLWLYIYFLYGAAISKSASIQIQTLNISESYQATLNNNFISITYRAPARIIDQAEKKIRATMDLSGIGPGTYKIKPVLTHPKEVEIESSNSEEILVTIEKVITKEFTIKAIKKGVLLSGIISGEAVLNPAKISINGLESLVNSINEVIVEINIENASSDIYGSSEVKIIDKNNETVDKINLSNRIINFHIPITSSDITKSVPVIPQYKGNPESIIKSINVTPQIITIRGKGEILSKITSLFTENIDIDKLNKNTTFYVNLILPEGVKRESENNKITVEIIVEEEIIKTFEDVQIKIINLNEDLEAILSINSITIVINGRKSIIDELDSIEAFIDLSGLKSGEHSINVQIKNIPNTITYKLYPEKIKVTIH
jgi:YbbR domain-containing protein